MYVTIICLIEINKYMVTRVTHKASMLASKEYRHCDFELNLGVLKTHFRDQNQFLALTETVMLTNFQLNLLGGSTAISVFLFTVEIG